MNTLAEVILEMKSNHVTIFIKFMFESEDCIDEGGGTTKAPQKIQIIL